MTTKTLYVAEDGKTFDNRAQCLEHEDRHNEEKRFQALQAKITDVRRTKDSGLLREKQEAMNRAKAEFLKACKGKRRHTAVFATDVQSAAGCYLRAYGAYFDVLLAYQMNRDNAKRQLAAWRNAHNRRPRPTLAVKE